MPTKPKPPKKMSLAESVEHYRLNSATIRGKIVEAARLKKKFEPTVQEHLDSLSPEAKKLFGDIMDRMGGQTFQNTIILSNLTLLIQGDTLASVGIGKSFRSPL